MSAAMNDDARDEEAHFLALEHAAIRTDMPNRTPAFEPGDLDLFTSAYIGLRGEIEFAHLFQLAVDTEIRPGGDGGKDFHININGVRTNIDVKTAMKPYYLFVIDKNIALPTDLFVLFGFDNEAGRHGRAYFVGWETHDIMARETLEESKYKVMNRVRHNTQLRDLYSLKNLMRKRTP